MNFEITPVSNLTYETSGKCVTIGLATVTDAVLSEAGECPISIGYSSRGNFVHDEDIRSKNETGFGTHDVIGCGLEIGGKGRVFFTCNGRVIGSIFQGYGIQGECYYPIVSLEGISTGLTANLGSSRFEFAVDGLNICNYAYAFRQQAPTAISNQGNDGLSSETPIWTEDDTEAVQDALQMLDQIIKAHSAGFTGGDSAVPTSALGFDEDSEGEEFEEGRSSFLNHLNDLFHLKIEKALTDGLKTFSELVRVDSSKDSSSSPSGALDSAVGRRSSLSDGAVTPTSSNKAAQSSKSSKKFSGSILEIVQLVLDSLLPLWQKMQKVISHKLPQVRIAAFYV